MAARLSARALLLLASNSLRCMNRCVIKGNKNIDNCSTLILRRSCSGLSNWKMRIDGSIVGVSDIIMKAQCKSPAVLCRYYSTSVPQEAHMEDNNPSSSSNFNSTTRENMRIDELASSYGTFQVSDTGAVEEEQQQSSIQHDISLSSEPVPNHSDTLSQAILDPLPHPVPVQFPHQQFISIRAYHLGRTIDFRRMALEYTHIPQALQRDSLILDLSKVNTFTYSSMKNSKQNSNNSNVKMNQKRQDYKLADNSNNSNNSTAFRDKRQQQQQQRVVFQRHHTLDNEDMNLSSSNNNDDNRSDATQSPTNMPSYAVIYRYGSIVFFNVSDTVRDEIEDTILQSDDTKKGNKSKSHSKNSMSSKSSQSLQAECIQRTKAFVSGIKFPHCTEEYGVIVTATATNNNTSGTSTNGIVDNLTGGNESSNYVHDLRDAYRSHSPLEFNPIPNSNNNNPIARTATQTPASISGSSIPSSKSNFPSSTTPASNISLSSINPTSSVPPTFISGDHVVVPSFDLNSVRVIGSVIGQSVALDHYAHETDAMLRIFTKLNEEMEQSGTFSMKKERLFQLVATNNTTLTDLVNNLKLLDRSETAWKYKQYSDLWEELRREFELEERFETLEYKLNLVQHNVKFFLEILQNRKSDTLEWIIIILISGEIGVSLYDIATRL